jgi:Mn-containing catalase
LPYPDKYDLLMDIATEELSHLEIVGATITMLCDGINGELKNAVEQTYLSRLMKGSGEKDSLIHDVVVSPQFFVLSGGGPTLTNSQGVPWSGAYVTANGDLTVDLRSNIAAESRAKAVYEYLMQFTDDPSVKETLRFLMTREITHFQQFSAALETIQPNFPPAIRQGDPRYSHLTFNFSDGENATGPWNTGQGPWPQGEQWEYIENPVEHVRATQGLTEQPVTGTKQTPAAIEKKNKALSKQRSEEVKAASPKGTKQWSTYPAKK